MGLGEMLKEIYLISHGLLLFHYNRDRSQSDTDEAVLSSGLMSAMRDFSEQTRSDVLQSFSTENEYFLFQPCKDMNRIIVGVFDRRAPEELARDILDRIQRLIAATRMPETIGVQLKPEEKDDLRSRIDKILDQTFNTGQMAAFVEKQMSGRTDIPLAFVLDLDEKKVLAHFARPHPLFKDTQVRDLLLVHTTICTTLSKLGIGEKYSYFSVQSPEYSIATCWSGRLLSMATGAMQARREDVRQAAAQICFQDTEEPGVSSPDAPRLLNKSSLLENGVVSHQSGEFLPAISGVLLSTLANNLDGFFKSITRRTFQGFEIASRNGSPKKLVVTRKESEKTMTVEVYQQ